MFSKSCNYAIKAAIFIAKHSLEENKVGFVDIAKEIDSPQAFTAKILQILVKSGVILLKVSMVVFIFLKKISLQLI